MGKFLIGIIMGIIIAGLAVFYLNNGSTQFINKTNSSQNIKTNTNSVPTILSPSTTIKEADSKLQNNQISAESSQDYDFYRILQDKEANTENKSNNSSSASVGSYYVQAGSFSDISAANNMKAQLSLLGYEVSIKKIKGSNGDVNKVVLGPYSSENDAIYVQQDLKSNNVKTIILKIN